MKSLTLVPAYGRTYHNRAQIVKDWSEGKDFEMVTSPVVPRGGYCSIRNLPKMKADGITTIEFRSGGNLIHVINL